MFIPRVGNMPRPLRPDLSDRTLKPCLVMGDTRYDGNEKGPRIRADRCGIIDRAALSRGGEHLIHDMEDRRIVNERSVPAVGLTP